MDGMSRPLTVAIAGYFLDLNYDRLQLQSLRIQANKDWCLFFIDPHKSESRRHLIYDFGSSTGVPSFWMPYSLPPMPRKYDWCIWNTPFLLTESLRVFRCQQWRILSQNLLDFIMSQEGNLSFQRNSTIKDWDASLNKVMFRDGREFELRNSAVDVKPYGDGWSDIPMQAYGDWCIRVPDFLKVNGIDEAATAIAHYEDIDFEIRWQIAHRQERVGSFLMVKDALFRVDDLLREKFAGQGQREYKFSRMNIEGWKDNCLSCTNSYTDLSLDKECPEAEFIGEHGGQLWYRCRKCSGVFHKQSHPHFEIIKKRMNEIHWDQASIGIDGRYGRNLRAIREDCLRLQSFEDRVELINRSWTNPRYLEAK